MKFVEQYFTKHHLFHTPHKWFLAFLSSPIHAAEMHYKRKYHLTFRHAKKLFIFDMLLLGSILTLVFGTIFWFSYDPTVTSLVHIDLSASQHRVKSGENISYDIHIQNNSSVSLQNPRLTLALPTGFVIDTNAIPENFDERTNTFSFSPLAPGASIDLSLQGIIYATTDQEDHITANFSYTQPDRSREELKISRIVQVLRDSVLAIDVDLPQRIVDQGSFPFTITLHNQGDYDISNISLPLTPPEYISIEQTSSSIGTIQEGLWHIDTLGSGKQARIEGIMRNQLPSTIPAVELSFIPDILLNNERFTQRKETQTIEVVHPNISLSSSWGQQLVPPGTSVPLSLTVHNSGDSTVENILISIPLANTVVNIPAFRQENVGNYQANIFTISQAHNAALSSLAPGQSETIQLQIPLQYNIAGQDIQFQLNPTLKAQVQGVPNGQLQRTIQSDSLQIGTNLFINASSRYYTAEGDQLGRGPLPPQVGKETKYWAIIRVQNTTSRVRDLVLTATLPAQVSWTDRHSVSHGSPIQYNPSTHQIRWELRELWPGQTVGINAELSITPSQSDIGAIVPLLQNIRVEGYDTYIQSPIIKTHANIDTSLPEDTIGKQKGVQVR